MKRDERLGKVWWPCLKVSRLSRQPAAWFLWRKETGGDEDE